MCGPLQQVYRGKNDSTELALTAIKRSTFITAAMKIHIFLREKKVWASDLRQNARYAWKYVLRYVNCMQIVGYGAVLDAIDIG